MHLDSSLDLVFFLSAQHRILTSGGNGVRVDDDAYPSKFVHASFGELRVPGGALAEKGLTLQPPEGV